MVELMVQIAEASKGLLSETYNLIESVGAKIVKQEWHSRFNDYIVYDYEPSCTDGFNIHLIVKGSKNTLDYLTYLVNKDREKRKHLEKCFNKPAVAMGVI